MAEHDNLSLIASVIEAGDARDLFRRVEAAARKLGFERFMLGLELRRPALDPVLHVASGWPEAWQQRYAEREYLRVDPTVALCQVQTRPVLWQPEIYSERSFELMEESRAYGIGHGLSVPVHEGPGIKSMISLARDRSIAADPRELQQLIERGQVLANCAHVAASRIVVPDLLEQLRPHLTAREKEILQLVALGKSSSVISDLLKVAEPTVEFHVRNFMRKLGVATRLQAVARGVALGLVN